MTNYEQIKKMSIKEMAIYFDSKVEYCSECRLPSDICMKHQEDEDDCVSAWLDWLGQKTTEGE